MLKLPESKVFPRYTRTNNLLAQATRPPGNPGFGPSGPVAVVGPNPTPKVVGERVRTPSVQFPPHCDVLTALPAAKALDKAKATHKSREETPAPARHWAPADGQSRREWTNRKSFSCREQEAVNGQCTLTRRSQTRQRDQHHPGEEPGGSHANGPRADRLPDSLRNHAHSKRGNPDRALPAEVPSRHPAMEQVVRRMAARGRTSTKQTPGGNSPDTPNWKGHPTENPTTKHPHQ